MKTDHIVIYILERMTTVAPVDLRVISSNHDADSPNPTGREKRKENNTPCITSVHLVRLNVRSEKI